MTTLTRWIRLASEVPAKEEKYTGKAHDRAT